jgi:hypothetical protein
MESAGAEKRKALNEASKRKGLYASWQEYSAKKAIQAMLIETALPEIEAEANRLCRA